MKFTSAIDSHLRAGKPLLQQSMMGAGMGFAQQASSRLRQEWIERRTWKVAIEADDDMYLIVHQWLADREDTAQRQALIAKTHFTRSDLPGSSLESGRRSTPALRFLIDGDIPQKISIDGFAVTVMVENSEMSSGSQSAETTMSQYFRPPRLVFRTTTRAGRDAVMKALLALDARRTDEKRKPSLMVLSQWGGWERRSDLPARTMESVIVHGSALDDLHDDLREFKNRESDYVRRGIPYHRAYLLTGPPGTGKTSTVKAVTNALGLDLWYAQLSDVDRDIKLMNIIGEVRPQGVLLLEDIDALSAAVTRETDNHEITASGLLNALDGVATPHGLVTIMTTNHPERLDPALARPGRIDRSFAFELPTNETIARHFEFFYGQPPRIREFVIGKSSAAVSEIFKRHMDDPDGAEQELAC